VADGDGGVIQIHNIVFDIGNVVVRWNPALIAERTFGAERGTADYAIELFGAPIWRAINLGHLSETEAKLAYGRDHGLSAEEADVLFFHVKDSQELVPGTTDLIARLASRNYRLFALTDNVHEIVAHLKDRYDFWDHFEGAAVSAELGVLKPSAEIYRHLLDTYGLVAEETLFLDDMPANAQGARDVGMHGLVFTTADQAIDDMRELGIVVD
jgi:putative hydrolase of the HAD superfamily